MKRLVLAAVWVSLTACFDFDGAYASYCDAGSCAGGGTTGGGTTAGGGAAAGGGAPDAGGTGGGDAGDGGCGGPSALELLVPANPLGVATCVGPARARLLDGCGAPIAAVSDVTLSFTSTSSSLLLYEDGACTIRPGAWAIPTGVTELSFYLRDPTPGSTTLRVDSSGLDGGTRGLDFACASNQRTCSFGCVPAGGCCDDGECNDGGVAFTCDQTSRRCVPPPCQLPAGCGTFDDRTAPGASRTITFGSSGYAPRCMRVTTTQDVTFSGDFFLHPLQQFCGPADVNMTQASDTTKVVRFGTFGTYGYRCARHPNFELGAVRSP